MNVLVVFSSAFVPADVIRNKSLKTGQTCTFLEKKKGGYSNRVKWYL